jgi:hypothetical protein
MINPRRHLISSILVALVSLEMTPEPIIKRQILALLLEAAVVSPHGVDLPVVSLLFVSAVTESILSVLGVSFMNCSLAGRSSHLLGRFLPADRHISVSGSQPRTNVVATWLGVFSRGLHANDP